MEDQLPIPDRWRLIEGLGVVRERWFDPYHQNTLKGDRPIDRAKVPWLPIRGDDWFFVLNAVSDTVFEPRTFPIPNGVQTTARPGRSEEHTSELQSLMRISYAVFCLKKKNKTEEPNMTIDQRISRHPTHTDKSYKQTTTN